MNLLDVYSSYNVNPVSGKGCYLELKDGTQVLDLYGGHGVISIGHNHAVFANNLKHQIDALIFYSNAVENPLQKKLADHLGRLSTCERYDLFLCNSGAEANENALKLASFTTGKSKVIAFENSFHGRTSAAVASTDIDKIVSPLNSQHKVEFIALEDKVALENCLSKGDVCAVIIEGIQGVGGLDEASTGFFQFLEIKCKEYGALLILDEVQSGYGRTGKFFAHQHHDISPDIITIAKGMGNGFPIAGVIVDKEIPVQKGMLGTTFGGNHLACTAGLSVLNVLESEQLMDNVSKISSYLKAKLEAIEEVKKVKGKGLMLGLEFEFEVVELRNQLLYDFNVFTGGSSHPNLLRILPPLTIKELEIDQFIHALKDALITMNHA